MGGGADDGFAVLREGFLLFFLVVEEGEEFALDEPGEAEQVQEDDLDDHHHPARGAQEDERDEEGFEADHAPAADAVDDRAW